MHLKLVTDVDTVVRELVKYGSKILPLYDSPLLRKLLDALVFRFYKLNILDFDSLIKLEDGLGVRVVRVSDLCYCSQKYMFVREACGILKRLDYDDLVSFVVAWYGDAIHRVLKGIIVEEGARKLTGLAKSHLVQKVIHVNDVAWLVVGSSDGLHVVNDCELVIVPVEVKYSGKHGGKHLPRHYKVQVGLYAWLYNIRRVKLLYVADKIYEHTIKVRIRDAHVLKHIVKWLRKTPLWEWECRYCQLRRWCKVVHCK